MRSKVWAGVTACVLLTACAENRPIVGPSSPLPPPPPPPPITTRAPIAPPAPSSTSEFSALTGWAEEDHAAAFSAFIAGCGAARAPDMTEVCQRARAAGPMGETAARAFFERHFRLDPVPETGLLTGYFSPVYDAVSVPDETFYAPVRPRPADLSASHPPADGAYADRAAIEARPAPDALAWMRPEDLFFLQIQGSGVLVFPDGRRARAVFDGTNGARFTPIAAPMRQRGLLQPAQASGDGIRGWLADHRGPEADSVMRLNPRYVFFRLAPDDGREPAGAAGAPLVPGRAVAVDPDAHAMGDLLWIDGAAPTLNGAYPAYRRLVMALDTGGAIKGAARADLYLGRGDAAGAEAGRVRHALRLYRLSPRVGE